jgi:hypothetical protein
LNAGFFYGALSGFAFVLLKTLKYSGGSRQDLPWAILIILVAGVAGGVLWKLGRTLLDPRPKRHDDSKANCQILRSDPKDSERWRGSN